VSRPLRTALSLVLEDARSLLEPVRARFDAESVASGVPLHVTVLFPFVARELVDAELLAELGRLFAPRAALAFALTRVAAFDGVVYAAPEPDAELLALMRYVWTKYPETPPYEGVHADPVPHATIGRALEPGAVHEIRALVDPLLPISCRVDCVTLLEEAQPDRWRERVRLPLGA
jgi:2'-5' RNA ligase